MEVAEQEKKCWVLLALIGWLRLCHWLILMSFPWRRRWKILMRHEMRDESYSYEGEKRCWVTRNWLETTNPTYFLNGGCVNRPQGGDNNLSLTFSHFTMFLSTHYLLGASHFLWKVNTSNPVVQMSKLTFKPRIHDRSAVEMDLNS